MIRALGLGVALLIGASVFGGVLGGLGDVLVPSLINGTPLGPNSSSSPLMWTLIAAALLVGAYEVRG